MSVDHFLFGTSLDLSALDLVVKAGTVKLFFSGLSEDSAMEVDAAEPLFSGLSGESAMEVDAAEPLFSGLSEDSAMEVDAAGPLSTGLDSLVAKSQMAIHIQNGVSIRAAYKGMRKRVRVEARRQRELEEGSPPEVVFSSC